jgi:hypothetical protein
MGFFDDVKKAWHDTHPKTLEQLISSPPPEPGMRVKQLLGIGHHQWVKHMVIPVQVISDPMTDTPKSMMMDEDIDRAMNEAITGCKKCNMPLNTDTVNTKCKGYDS